ncbi:MAG TPA: DegT/DnrJ/EryC1/StrS family aminotransferase [Phycisphaerales bacterium]|nr:DegT/DnrJ/EryC1/StrS family aminotransferase [Phycisphaerales bacterium]
MRVYLSRPDITEAEIDAVCEVLRSPNLSLGPKLPEFETAFAEYVGRKYAIAVNSGTSGLFLCAQAMGLGPGDEVITTPFTFIATVNFILMTGATPVFVDIDPVSLNLDPAKIEAKITAKTKAIVPVEVFGNPAGMDVVCDIAAKHGLRVIEDCCEALGSSLGEQMAGTFGDAGVFAFYPNKQMTTGEGGMIVTDDERLAELCCSLRNQGRGRGGGWLAHERMGYNYRLSDINCALGLVQLSRMEEFIEKRAAVARTYAALLAGEKRVKTPTEPADARMSWFVYVIRLDERYTMAQRNALIHKLLDCGIQVSNYFPPAHLQPFMVERFGYKTGDFPITDAVCERTMALPFHNNLTVDEARLVCGELSAALDEIDKVQ